MHRNVIIVFLCLLFLAVLLSVSRKTSRSGWMCMHQSLRRSAHKQKDGDTETRRDAMLTTLRTCTNRQRNHCKFSVHTLKISLTCTLFEFETRATAFQLHRLPKRHLVFHASFHLRAFFSLLHYCLLGMLLIKPVCLHILTLPNPTASPHVTRLAKD